MDVMIGKILVRSKKNCKNNTSGHNNWNDIVNEKNGGLGQN